MITVKRTFIDMQSYYFVREYTVAYTLMETKFMWMREDDGDVFGRMDALSHQIGNMGMLQISQNTMVRVLA